MSEPSREEAILKLGRDKPLAHRVLFGHRHGNETPAFHDEHIDLWHSSIERFIEIVFRGGAKSTRAEEAITLEACLRSFKNCVILGESETRAVERLRSIKHEFNTNPYIEELFGDLGEGPAETWMENKVVLANGVCIQALGRGQSMRGIKHLDQRPDLLLVDDLEDDESVATPEARAKWLGWFFSVVLPSLDPNARIRVGGTPLNPEALLEVAARDVDKWVSRRVPIKYRDGLSGDWIATWPDRFPMTWIDDKEEEYKRLGLATRFAQEYMCQAEDASQKSFTSDLFKVEPKVRTWQAVFAMVDPARTVKNRSATTGFAIWSWENRRLVVWDAYGQRWRPDEIVNEMFSICETYAPVAIGVEEDGLNEFILQPIRQEEVKRGFAIPFKAMRAPKGKIDFIKSLQPFFKAGEVIFAKPVPDLVSQLLSFPTGDIDVPNALAYAPRLRPGTPMYDGFNPSLHVVEGDLEPTGREPVWLGVNSSGPYTTGVLIQTSDGVVRILADWVREGDPGATLGGIVGEAALEAGRSVRVLAGLRHFDNFDTIGMRAAAARVPVLLRRGGDEKVGREEIRARFSKQVRGQSSFLISTRARWTLNGFAAGYARQVSKGGILSEEAEEGPYRTLCEGLEAFAAVLRAGLAEEDTQRTFATANDGRKYLTSLGQKERA